MRATILTTIVFMSLAGPTYAASPLPEVAVTACGQIIPKKTLGYLTGDLDCTGYVGSDPDILEPGVAVTVGWKSKLDLRGFTITAASTHGVLCDNLHSQGKRRGCEVFNGTVTGAAQRGIGAVDGYIHDVTVTNSGVGIYEYLKGRIEDVVVTDSVFDGIRVGKTKTARATVTNSGGLGIVNYFGRVVITDSTVTGSATNAFCTMHPGDCADIGSRKEPKVENLVCGTSLGMGDGAPATWGVCSND